MQSLGERLGQAVGERANHDRAVVVELGGETIGERLATVDRDRERADVIRRPVSAGATKSASDRFGRESAWSACWRSIGKREPSSRTTSSPSALAGQKPYTPRACSEPLPRDLVEKLVRPGEEIARDGALLGIVEDRRIAALELPGMEEERPVDVLAQRCDVLLHQRARR